MADSGNNFVSLAVYNRMPVYLKALLALKRDGKKFVSSVILADYVRENPSLVKKDLSYAITSVGKPKVGYDIDSLILDVENCAHDVVIVCLFVVKQFLVLAIHEYLVEFVLVKCPYIALVKLFKRNFL